MASEYLKLEQEIAKLIKTKDDMLARERPGAVLRINELIQTYQVLPKEVHFGAPKRRGRKPGVKLAQPQVRAIKAKEAAAKKSNGIEKVRPAKGRPKVNGKLPPKYQLGEHTWSGFARKPAWVQAHLAKGGTLEAIRIQ